MEEIFRYTVDEAVEDGYLVRVSEAVAELAGFEGKPVVISSGLYQEHIQVGDAQEFSERFSAVLGATVKAIKEREDWMYEFKVSVRKNDPEVRLWATVQEDEQGKMLVTIMRPEDY